MELTNFIATILIIGAILRTAAAPMDVERIEGIPPGTNTVPSNPDPVNFPGPTSTSGAQEPGSAIADGTCVPNDPRHICLLQSEAGSIGPSTSRPGI